MTQLRANVALALINQFVSMAPLHPDALQASVVLSLYSGSQDIVRAAADRSMNTTGVWALNTRTCRGGQGTKSVQNGNCWVGDKRTEKELPEEIIVDGRSRMLRYLLLPPRSWLTAVQSPSGRLEFEIPFQEVSVIHSVPEVNKTKSAFPHLDSGAILFDFGPKKTVQMLFDFTFPLAVFPSPDSALVATALKGIEDVLNVMAQIIPSAKIDYNPDWAGRGVFGVLSGALGATQVVIGSATGDAAALAQGQQMLQDQERASQAAATQAEVWRVMSNLKAQDGTSIVDAAFEDEGLKKEFGCPLGLGAAIGRTGWSRRQIQQPLSSDSRPGMWSSMMNTVLQRSCLSFVFGAAIVGTFSHAVVSAQASCIATPQELAERSSCFVDSMSPCGCDPMTHEERRFRCAQPIWQNALAAREKRCNSERRKPAKPAHPATDRPTSAGTALVDGVPALLDALSGLFGRGTPAGEPTPITPLEPIDPTLFTPGLKPVLGGSGTDAIDAALVDAVLANTTTLPFRTTVTSASPGVPLLSTPLGMTELYKRLDGEIRWNAGTLTVSTNVFNVDSRALRNNECAVVDLMLGVKLTEPIGYGTIMQTITAPEGELRDVSMRPRLPLGTPTGVEVLRTNLRPCSESSISGACSDLAAEARSLLSQTAYTLVVQRRELMSGVIDLEGRVGELRSATSCESRSTSTQLLALVADAGTAADAVLLFLGAPMTAIAGGLAATKKALDAVAVGKDALEVLRGETNDITNVVFGLADIAADSRALSAFNLARKAIDASAAAPPRTGAETAAGYVRRRVWRRNGWWHIARRIRRRHHRR